MNKGNTPIVQTYYKISDVKHKEITPPLDYTTNVFTYLKNKSTAKRMRQINVNDVEQLINKYSKAGKSKDNAPCMLKGIYKDYFNGDNCIKNSPYLFIDIDVKDKKENTHLLDPELNQTIFNELKKVAVLLWRSDSKNGIAGILYVPQLASYLNDKRDLHLKAGKEIRVR